jgi:membrane protein DedA with SNARE-associated domain
MEALIQDWGYIILFLYSFGGGFVALIVASILAYGGDLNIVFVMLTAGVANFIGDQFLFTLARNNKDQAKQLMQKYKRKIAITHLMMRKYGSLVIFLQKYIYGIKTLIPLAMGLTKYNTKQFIFFNALATILWSLVFGLGAYMLGEVVYTYIDEFKTYGIILIICIVALIAYMLKKIS